MHLTSFTTQLRLGHASKLFTPHLIRLFLCQRQARRMIASVAVQFTRQFPLHPARKIQPQIFNNIATLTLRPIGKFQPQIFEHIATFTLHPIRKVQTRLLSNTAAFMLHPIRKVQPKLFDKITSDRVRVRAASLVVNILALIAAVCKAVTINEPIAFATSDCGLLLSLRQLGCRCVCRSF